MCRKEESAHPPFLFSDDALSAEATPPGIPRGDFVSEIGRNPRRNIIFAPTKNDYDEMRRAFVLCLIAMMAIMGLSTSCLKEFDSVYSPGLTAAVCRELEVDSTLFEGDSVVMMATTRFGWVYEEGLSAYSNGKCLLLDFTYDPNLPENEGAEGKGYYTVTIRNEVSVPQSSARTPLTATDRLLTNEQPVAYAVSPVDTALFMRLDDFLFIPSVCLTTSGQTLNWELTYDPDQQATVEERRTIYALYLRATATTGRAEDATETLVSEINAFDLSGFIDDIQARGGREADTYIQIHYINQINPMDSAQFAWGVTDPLSIN